MRKRILWGICVLFLCGAALTSRAASYEELWKQVKQYERKDLPKSAYEVVILPVTIRVVKAVKRIDGRDVYDEGISYKVWKVSEL